jgi:O-antigen biosynthesis protein
MEKPGRPLHPTSATGRERLVAVLRPPLRWLAPAGTRRRRTVIGVKRLVNLVRARGPKRVLRKAIRVWEWPYLIRSLAHGRLHDVEVNSRYREWRQQTATVTSRAREMRATAARMKYRPMISIIVPVYNPEPNWLRDAIESVRAQYYDNWQLCIADDASSKQGVRALLADYDNDPRIKVVFKPANEGISAASNAALALAEGEYVAFLDHDDELSPDALYQVVQLLNERRDLDFIYSDEDKRDPKGALASPFFKPDWSPDLEYSSNYVTHFSVYRRDIVENTGGFRSEFDGSQDYDLALRVTEQTDKIGHIRKILYTWRMVPGSAASSLAAKPYAYTAAKRALSESLQRRGVDAWVEDGATLGWYRIRYRILGDPLVSVIIPTRDRADLLAKCLDSLESSSFGRLEIIVVDNGSVEEATKRLLDSRDLKVVPDPGDFNFSRLINAGAAAASGDYLLLLNNDVEAINDDWIEALLEHAQRPEVGIVGARLLYPNGTPQHEGVALGIGGTFAGHIDWRNYLGLSEAVRNCSAVTAAAALTRRSVFAELNGFDESFRVAYGDVDYCLRARERGYLVVYTPYAALYHHESASRGDNHPPEDEKLARRRWGGLTDPYYNYAFDDVLQPWVYAPQTT